VVAMAFVTAFNWAYKWGFSLGFFRVGCISIWAFVFCHYRVFFFFFMFSFMGESEQILKL